MASTAYRHQYTLVMSVLWIIGVFSFVIGTLNVVVFAAYELATFNYISLTAAVLIGVYHQRHRQLRRSSWLVCLAITFNVMMFMHLVTGNSYSVLWVTVIPPIVFFLLGRKVGAWYTAIVFGYTIGFMAYQLPRAQPLTMGLGSLLNIIEVFTAHWFLFRHYEKSRADAYDELERLSNTDRLTGLANRLSLDATLSQFTRSENDKVNEAAVVLADIDHFKTINDRFGHLQGDRVLQHIAQLLRLQVRESDFVGRWGGEEFMLILPNTSTTEAFAICEQLREQIAELKLFPNERTTMSFGVASLQPNQAPEQAVAAADQALYEAKHQGRNRTIMNF
ncbi:GGDEF domain-containing protein [Pseudidiomarina aestuarii]|uniref:diguanylate cyclase n=1 Tax=Pseudidiomarina aestuarii TaxID=624146 RepID=A0A7Z7ET08_9GAMM|nr:GGDEF domain-containing protein [Pseudidiomarina aestuarii]RUO39567.1 GGDEF domain-containing protein [Pseudidiomarina aestuarii]